MADDLFLGEILLTKCCWTLGVRAGVSGVIFVKNDVDQCMIYVCIYTHERDSFKSLRLQQSPEMRIFAWKILDFC